MNNSYDIDKTYSLLQWLAGAALFGMPAPPAGGGLPEEAKLPAEGGRPVDVESPAEGGLPEEAKLPAGGGQPEEAEILQDADWSAVLREAHYQQIVSLTYPVVEELATSKDSPISIPAKVMDSWCRQRDKHIVNSLRNKSHHYELHKLLTEAGIPYVILKGLASGSYYRDPMVRSYGDVDFYVKKEDKERTDKLLESEGFLFTFEHEKHRVYRKDGAIYEMHTDIVGVPHEATKEAFDRFFDDIVDKAEDFKLDGQICRIPSPAHHAVVLLLHKVEHLRYDGIGFRHLCDWAAFAGSMPESFFEDEMAPRLKEMGLWRFAEIMTDFCTEYLGLGKCSWAGSTDPAYLEKIHADVMSSGNFGIKSSGEKTTARRHAAHRVSRGERGFTKVFINMLTDSAKAAFPITERRPMLLPAACAWVGIRHAIRIAKGNRSLSGTSQMMTEAKARREIFDRWHLFEPEDY